MLCWLQDGKPGVDPGSGMIVAHDILGPAITDGHLTDEEILAKMRSRFTGWTDAQIVVSLAKKLTKLYIERNAANGKPRNGDHRALTQIVPARRHREISLEGSSRI
jgi:hypothetical protein